VLVATDYFTKWTEVIPLRNMTHKEVIDFVQEHIVHRFDIPQTLTTDQGASFMSQQFKEFVESLKIKLLNSSPCYAQENGQAESSNKILIKLIKKKIAENPRQWHEILSEALLAHRTSQHEATKVTPFELVYGQKQCFRWRSICGCIGLLCKGLCQQKTKLTRGVTKALNEKYLKKYHPSV
jgi:transposase InsO family protein